VDNKIENDERIERIPVSENPRKLKTLKIIYKYIKSSTIAALCWESEETLLN
jgi:hypothetical protein